MAVKTLDQLKHKLTKFGDLQICKEGVVLSVLITGSKLSNSLIVNQIQELIITYGENNFPIIEAFSNDDHFFCMILKPRI